MFSQVSVTQVYILVSFVLTGQSRQIDNGGADHNLSEVESSRCNKDHKWPDQPSSLKTPVVKKCCGDDENLHIINSTVENFGCYRNNYPIYVNFSKVELYEDCILFQNRSAGEVTVKFSKKPIYHEFFPCMYYGDMFGSHIIQNGSLLVTSIYGHFFYRLNNDFCIEANGYNGAYMVCHHEDETQPESKGVKDVHEAQFTQKFLTFVSIPCFVGIAILYAFMKELRNLHGVYVISLVSFMAVEFVLRSVLSTVKRKNQALPLRHTTQYFDLVNHFWILVLYSNTVLFLWIYLPYKKIPWRSFGICCYGLFFICCLIIPLIISNGLKEDEITNFIDFFTTPKTTITLTYILLLVIIFIGSNRLKALVKKEILHKYYQNSVIDTHDIDMQRHHFQLEEVQNRLSCLTSLTGLMVVLRIFYIPGHNYLVFIRDIVKSFQGVAFVLIFIVLRYKDIRTFTWRRFQK